MFTKPCVQCSMVRISQACHWFTATLAYLWSNTLTDDYNCFWPHLSSIVQTIINIPDTIIKIGKLLTSNGFSLRHHNIISNGDFNFLQSTCFAIHMTQENAELEVKITASSIPFGRVVQPSILRITSQLFLKKLM